MRKTAILGGASLAFLALGAIANPASSETAPARPSAFAQCAACHSTERGKTLFGPSLAGVAGRRAGSLPGYAYSQALKSSGLTWNAATLDRWLASPQRTVPGTKMPFAGIADPLRRRQIVDYLMTLKP
ncbi:MAG: cytochrome c family protein [Sphingomonadaceae bacterium]